MVNRACEAAEDASWSYSYSNADQRAVFLEEIDSLIDYFGSAITANGSKEMGLPELQLDR